MDRVAIATRQYDSSFCINVEQTHTHTHTHTLSLTLNLSLILCMSLSISLSLSLSLSLSPLVSLSLSLCFLIISFDVCLFVSGNAGSRQPRSCEVAWRRRATTPVAMCHRVHEVRGPA